MMQELVKNEITQLLSTANKYLTVKQFSANNPAFTELALRNIIFKAQVRQSSYGIIKSNGLVESGALVRVGRKILINEPKFYAWIEAQNAGAQL